jgi:hypothetical protein
MPEFSDLSQLEKYLNEKINNALRTEVADEARSVMQEHVMSDVYDKYTPSPPPEGYVRTGNLYKDILTQMIDDNTLSIEDLAKDEETGRLVAPIIESGVGYTWKDSRIYNMQPFPRPFVENTAKDLENGKAKLALAMGLKRQGLTVE